MYVESKKEFRELSEDHVAKSLASGNMNDSVVVEVKRMSDAIVSTFKAEAKRTGRYPGGLLALKARCPIEDAAIRSATSALEKILGF
jgi:hypothetical protein